MAGVVTVGKSALAKVNIVISQGADNVYQFRWSTRDEDTGVTTPVDLSTATARAQIRAKVGAAVWTEMTTENGGVMLGSDGLITVLLQDSVTEAAEWNTYKTGVWDLEIDQDGLVTRFAEGTATVYWDVTRDPA